MEDVSKILLELAKKYQELSAVCVTLSCAAKKAEALEAKIISEESQTPIVTYEKVREMLLLKHKQGFAKEIKELIEKYDATKLSEVAPGDYAALLEDASWLVSKEEE
ncbi:MAG: hypothetical protein LBB34_01215 [Holosporales bacterium]|jgi:hypothetical protein|nr:hypothetical protein [Holosporales bacterium]